MNYSKKEVEIIKEIKSLEKKARDLFAELERVNPSRYNDFEPLGNNTTKINFCDIIDPNFYEV